MEKNGAIPILIPLQPEEFWMQIRMIVKEELSLIQKKEENVVSMITQGLTEKPLFKVSEICTLFSVSKTTVYDWIEQGKLKRVKVGSRVYFLGSDIRQLIENYS